MAWRKIAGHRDVSGCQDTGYNALVKGLPSRSWALASSASLLLGAAWLRTGGGLLLLAVAVATVWTAILTLRQRPQPAAAGFAAILVAFIALEALDARRQSKFANEAVAQRTAEEASATSALSARLSAEADRLRSLAVAALDVPAEASLAFDRLE